MSCPIVHNGSSDEHEDKELLSAAEQQERVWKRLQERYTARTESFSSSDSTPSSLQRTWPSYDTVVADVASADYQHTLTCQRDLISPHESTGKSLCPYGAICCVRLELFPCPDGVQPYTGLLTPGTTLEHGILRLSSAMKPPGDAVKSAWARTALYATGRKLRNAKLFPCAALKIFRHNGNASGNLLFGGSKIGQRETDYFAHCQCTSMTEQMPRVVRPFVRKFWQYSDYPLSLGVSEFCSKSVDGPEEEEPANVQFPFAIILQPCFTLQDNLNDHQRQDENADSAFDHFLDKVLTVPAQTVLFDVYACPSPLDVPDPSKLQRIGRIVTSSAMLPSYPNDGMFFKHQKKEDDYELRPTWGPALQTQIAIDGGQTKGTVGQLAGWKLFEQHIQANKYVDFERDVSSVQRKL